MRTGEIMVLMARAAFFSGHAVAFRASSYVHRVRMAIIALPRKVATRVTIHTPRMPQDGNEGGEQGSISTRWGRRSGRRCSWVFGRADRA